MRHTVFVESIRYSGPCIVRDCGDKGGKQAKTFHFSLCDRNCTLFKEKAMAKPGSRESVCVFLRDLIKVCASHGVSVLDGTFDMNSGEQFVGVFCLLSVTGQKAKCRSWSSDAETYRYDGE